MNDVDVVYTMWANLKKTDGMEVGQVGFHKDREVCGRSVLLFFSSPSAIVLSKQGSTNQQQNLKNGFFIQRKSPLHYGCGKVKCIYLNLYYCELSLLYLMLLQGVIGGLKCESLQQLLLKIPK